MRPVYINSAQSISAQDTLAPDFMKNLQVDLSETITYAQQPSYKDFISPGMIRRMSKVVKMSTVAAQKALEEANVEMPDAIIVGTGIGCSEDSEKFLKNVIQNNEEFLTPTYFIQSTHNTVAGQIALGIQCHAYNFTYVNTASSLEFSLLDAKLQISDEDAQNILVGATDETANRTAELYQLVNIIKKKEDLPFEMLNSKTKGVFWGEGSSFFVVGADKNKNTYAELGPIAIQNKIELSDIQNFTDNFLKDNNLNAEGIDAVLLGFSGDAESDQYYHEVAKLFPDCQQLYYKHLSGEFNTASGFGLFMACHILKDGIVPEIMKINSSKKKEINNILIYNQFMGKDHNFTLLKKA